MSSASSTVSSSPILLASSPEAAMSSHRPPGLEAHGRSRQSQDEPDTTQSDNYEVSAESSSSERRLPTRSADRKRRLTSTAEEAWLQRRRSGEPLRPALGSDGRARAVVPNRSVSMVLPSSRMRSSVSEGSAYRASVSEAQGSSYATAIDLSSSPPAPAAHQANVGNGYRRRTSIPHDAPVYARNREGTFSSRGNGGPGVMEFAVPRWQPDSEATNCPICGTVFSFWYRKHHCRKCGRVVCASCSPHRITIPRQYIVRPPESSPNSVPASTPIPLLRSPHFINLVDDESTSFPSTINPALGGGEEVRLCNPCVPDPNPNPPQSYATLRPSGHRYSQSLSSTLGNRHLSIVREQARARRERRTLGANDRPSFFPNFGLGIRQSVHDTVPESIYEGLQLRRTRRASVGSGETPPLSNAHTSSHHLELSLHNDGLGSMITTLAPRLPRRSAVSERDLCPVCGLRFSPLSDQQPLEAREAHIRDCIESHGISPALRSTPPFAQWGPATMPPPPPQPSSARMLKFTATEKDCLGDDGATAECTICMEDYEVGQTLARLECLCKFHRRCIDEWFERKMECPVHKSVLSQ